MKKKLPFLLFVFLVAVLPQVYGQEPVEMADIMRSNGKIYVVVTVAAIVMAGLLVYLVMLDRKISALEKRMKDKLR